MESVWLQILKFFEIQPPQSSAIFLKQHHAYYVEKVLDNRTLQLVMREAQRWRGTAHASAGLEELLADIEQVLEDAKNVETLSEEYSVFIKRIQGSKQLNRLALSRIQDSQRRDQEALKQQLLA